MTEPFHTPIPNPDETPEEKRERLRMAARFQLQALFATVIELRNAGDDSFAWRHDTADGHAAQCMAEFSIFPVRNKLI